ncbi:MAG: DUF5908 family protein [Pseudomonadota bacterium]
MPIEVRELHIRTTVDEPTEAESEAQGNILIISEDGDHTASASGAVPTEQISLNFEEIKDDTIDFGDLTHREPNDADPVLMEDFSLNFEEIKYTPPPGDDTASGDAAAMIDPYTSFKFQVEFEG